MKILYENNSAKLLRVNSEFLIYSPGGIIWSEPENITGDSDVINSGLLVASANFGSNSTVVINGVTFFSFSGGGVNSLTSGGITIAGTGTAHALTSFGNVGSSFSPFSSLSTDYKQLLSPLIFSSNNNNSTPPAKITVTLNGLMIGQQYQIQYWVNDSRSYPQETALQELYMRECQIGSKTLRVNAARSGGSTGQWILGTFTANSTSQSFDVIGSGTNLNTVGPVAYANAIQVRAVLSSENNFFYGVDEEGIIWQINPVNNTYNSIYDTKIGLSNAMSYDPVRKQILFIDSTGNLRCLDQNNNHFQVATSTSLGLSASINSSAAYYNNAIWIFKDVTASLLKINLTYSGQNNTPSVASVDTYIINNINASLNNFGDIAINLNTGILYGSNLSGRFFSLNLNGNPTNTFNLIKSSGIPGMQLSFDSNYKILFGHETRNGKWYTVDTNTGNISYTGFTSILSGMSNGSGARDLCGPGQSRLNLIPTPTPTPTGYAPTPTPTPVQDGLLINLDATNSASYPGTGKTWYDLSGNNNHAFLRNGVLYDGKSLVFDGLDDYAEILNNSTINNCLNSDFSFEIWVNYYNQTWTYPKIFSKGMWTYNGAINGPSRLIGTPNLIFWQHIVGSTDTGVCGLGAGAPAVYGAVNTWHNIVYTRTGGTIKCYLNGVLQAASSIPCISQDLRSNYNIRIASSSNGENSRQKVMIFRQYNRGLSDSEVLLNYNSGVQKTYSTIGILNESPYEDRGFIKFNSSELDKVDFSEVLQDDATTLRINTGGFTFLKWEGKQTPPEFIQNLETGQIFSFEEMDTNIGVSSWNNDVDSIASSSNLQLQNFDILP